MVSTACRRKMLAGLDHHIHHYAAGRADVLHPLLLGFLTGASGDCSRQGHGKSREGSREVCAQRARQCLILSESSP